jgi:hypothetical protein
MAARSKRPQHEAQGDPCTKCGQAADKHRQKPIIGIDGEGHDLPSGKHVYTYLAAVSETGKTWETRFAPEGLTHDECAELLLSLPRSSKKFSFMFSYDLAKILESMPYGDLYELFRPDVRVHHRCEKCAASWGLREPSEHRQTCDGKVTSRPAPVRWNGRRYNWKHGPFDIADAVTLCRSCGSKWPDEDGCARKDCPAFKMTHVGKKPIRVKRRQRSARVWDSFKFFQSSFVAALDKWEVGTKQERDRIRTMKKKRGKKTFGTPDEIKRYCRSECQLLAVLMRKVLTACSDVDLHLRDYFGAGSIASALLTKYNVADYRGPDLGELDLRHPGIADAIMRAYAGGRAEMSTLGRVEGLVYGIDLASAYPAADWTLPCLKCGEWKLIAGTHKHVDKLARRASLALCAFRVRTTSPKERDRMAWAPLPYREKNGSIAYPTGFEGWAWGPEAFAAVDGWKDLVTFTHAWLYETPCKHRPFHFMPDVYRKRTEWGSDGRGIVLKLGPNAVYGKTAQNVGVDPPFRSWVWAGATTAVCRGAILRAIVRARDPWDVLSIATDGIISKVDLAPRPLTKDNGTSDLKKPLGSWEKTKSKVGIFLAKPGVYWPLDVTKEQVDRFKARGLGRYEVAGEHVRIMRGFVRWKRTHKTRPVIHVKSRRFYGAKTSVLSFYRCDKCGGTWAGRPREGCKDPRCSSFGEVPGTIARTTLLHTPMCKACEAKKGTKEGLLRCDCEGCSREKPSARRASYCGKCNRPAFGQWAVRDQHVTFDAMPKRERDTLSPRELFPDFARMRVRDVSDPETGRLGRSMAYGGETSPEGKAAQEAKESDLEQEDADLDDLDEGEPE